MKVNGQFHISAALPDIKIPEDTFFQDEWASDVVSTPWPTIYKARRIPQPVWEFWKKKGVMSLGMRRGVAGLVVPYVSKDLVASSSVNH
jgi:hypothetical protein